MKKNIEPGLDHLNDDRNGKNRQLNILVVDDDRRMTKTLLDILELKGYQAQAAHSGQEALQYINEIPFDCVLTDIKMPGMNGVELYKFIRESHPDLPVVLMTAYAANELIEEGLDAGVLAAMTKPLDINLLLSFFHSLSKEPTVAIVDDDPKFCHALGEILRMRGYDVLAVNDPRGAYETITKKSQIVLLDMKLDQTNGLEVLQGIRKRHPSLPVVLVTGYRKEMLPAIENALKISAYTCLYKPFQIDELLEILTKLHHRELSKMLQQSFKQ